MPEKKKERSLRGGDAKFFTTQKEEGKRRGQREGERVLRKRFWKSENGAKQDAYWAPRNQGGAVTKLFKEREHGGEEGQR